jgi:hypothetical protein
MEHKGQKVKNDRPTFWETMLLLTLKRNHFVKKMLLLKSSANYCLDPEPKPEPEKELEPKPELQ